MIPGWDGSHGVVCAHGLRLRTRQKLENHHSGTRVRRALESSGLPHMPGRGASLSRSHRDREAELGQATRAADFAPGQGSVY